MIRFTVEAEDPDVEKLLYLLTHEFPEKKSWPEKQDLLRRALGWISKSGEFHFFHPSPEPSTRIDLTNYPYLWQIEKEGHEKP